MTYWGTPANRKLRCRIGAPISIHPRLGEVVAYIVIGLVAANIGVAIGRLVVG